jgi:hypothetical protein
VSFAGATRIELVGETGTFGGGSLPAGTYTIRAEFDGGGLIPAGKVTLGPGDRVELTCDPRFKRCQPK